MSYIPPCESNGGPAKRGFRQLRFEGGADLWLQRQPLTLAE